MPFSRPTLTDLRQLALQDVYSVLGVKGLLRFAILRVLTWVAAGLAHLHYGYLDWIALQSTPFTATAEYLEAWAALVGVTRKPASYASGSIAVSNGSAFDVLIPAGVTVRRAADAAAFISLEDVTVPANGTANVGVQAAIPGAVGNTDAGMAMAFLSPIAGIAGAIVSFVVAGGADQEVDDPFRTRMLQVWSAPPQGGAAADYIEWALAVPGVSRAWVNPLGAGAGTVVVFTMWDVAEAAHGGFPQGSDGVASSEPRGTAATGEQLIVANAIYLVRPVTALVFSVSPIAYPVAFVIHAPTVVPTAVRALVLQAIDAVFIALASPLAVELEISAFGVAIAAVPGMPKFTLEAPSGPINAPLGYLPDRGAVTYA